MYYNGYYVDKSDIKALQCFEKATSEGLYLAGLMYMGGADVEWNDAKGMEMMRKAAAEGHEEAIEFLAEADASEDDTTNNNVFQDPNATQFHMNSVHLQPRLVYWDNGTLVAECVLTNGFVSNPVCNLYVKEITISNNDGVIAAASFGALKDVAINAYGSIVWTFKFGPDCVYIQNADLSTLKTVYNVTYSY